MSFKYDFHPEALTDIPARLVYMMPLASVFSAAVRICWGLLPRN
jgi:hypothetical protein